MNYKDLSNYSYNLSFEIESVKNVGWLSKGVDFSKGTVPVNFLNKLFAIIKRKEINVTRGIHDCELCNSDDFIYVRLNQDSVLLGHGEIWIPSLSGQIIYASPTLIYHYIEKHNYLPPFDYIDSIIAFDLNGNWDAEKICNQLANR